MGRIGENKLHLKRPKGKKDNNTTAGGSSSSPSSPPWIELPRDVTENILRRLGPVEILENAQNVCTTWRSVCSEPSLWRVIDMKNSGDFMCRRAVDLSQGELIGINIARFGTDDLLHYISQRSSRLKCLRLEWCDNISSEGLTASVKKFPELEELHLFFMAYITARDIEAISICCPKLKSFTFSECGYMYAEIDNRCALTVAKNMPNLKHLCLFGNRLSNEGLKAILDGCPNLESLDIRQCKVDLQGDFGRVCSERIKNLKHTSDWDFDYEYWDDMNYDGEDYWNGSSDDYEDYEDYY